MWNVGLDEAQAGIKIAGRNMNNFRYADDTTLMAESEEELKSLWWKWKRRVKMLAWNSTFRKLRSWQAITSWQIDGETMETVADFIFWGSKITADDDWEESYDQPRQHIKKERHYFVNKGPSSQNYGFSSSHVWMWELDHKETKELNCGVREDSWESLELQGY